MKEIINGIPIEITRKSIKTLRITVSQRDGAVRVSAPKYLGGDTIRNFIYEKFDWILKQRNRITAKIDTQKELYENGCSAFLWGTEYPVELREGAKTAVKFADGKFILTSSHGVAEEEREKAFDLFFRTELAERIARRLPDMEAFTGLACSGWRIRKMVSRWGTCNTRDKKLCFSQNLAKKPPQCLDYVIIHELIHIAVPNHGTDFKARLDRFCPNWRAIKKLLNG